MLIDRHHDSHNTEWLATHTGMPDLFDPAVLTALLGDQPTEEPVYEFPPFQIHRTTRTVTVQLTPRLTVTRQVTIIRSCNTRPNKEQS